MICDASPMRIHYGRAGLPPETLNHLTELYRELGSHYKVAEAIGRTSQATWQVLKRIGVITPKKRNPGVKWKGEKFTPDKDGFMRSTTFASRKKGETRLLHRLIWEDAHGKIKKRERKTHMFLFRDGNRGNCQLTNLIWVSRKEAANFRAWNGNGSTKWREKHDMLVGNLKRLELAQAEPEEIEKARLELESLPPWAGNGDPKKRRRQKLRWWARRTPEERAQLSAKLWATRRANRAKKYAELPQHGIAMLDVRSREILHRHFVVGQSCDEIGAGLEIHRASVSLVMIKALKQVHVNARIVEERVAGVEKWILREAYLIAPKYHLSPEDLAQEGRKNALRAAQLFDDSLGFKFLSYCARGITSRMHRFCRDTCRSIRVPDGKFFSHPVSMTSLDAPVGEDSDTTFGDVLCGEGEVTTGSLDLADRAGLLDELLSKLSGRDERIMRALFFENRTQADVSRDFGITRGGIHMVKREALKRLRKMPQLKKLKEAA